MNFKDNLSTIKKVMAWAAEKQIPMSELVKIESARELELLEVGMFDVDNLDRVYAQAAKSLLPWVLHEAGVYAY